MSDLIKELSAVYRVAPPSVLRAVLGALTAEAILTPMDTLRTVFCLYWPEGVSFHTCEVKKSCVFPSVVSEHPFPSIPRSIVHLYEDVFAVWDATRPVLAVMSTDGTVLRGRDYSGHSPPIPATSYGMTKVGEDQLAITTFSASNIILFSVHTLDVLRILDISPPLVGACGITTIAHNTQFAICEHGGAKVSVVNVHNGSLVRTIGTGILNSPYAICSIAIGPDDDERVALTDLSQHEVVIFFTTTGFLQRIRAMDASNLSAIGFIMGAESDVVVVSDYNDSHMLFIDVLSATIVRRMALGHRAEALCVGGNQIFLADETTKAVHSIE